MKADAMSTGLQQRVSTRLAFLAAGMAMSAWAPLVLLGLTAVAMARGPQARPRLRPVLVAPP